MVQSLAVASLLLIDGFNVLHAGILTGRDRSHWWHADAQRRLVARVEHYPCAETTMLWIVFDRRAERHQQGENVTSDDPRLQIFYAPSADDWIVAQVEQYSNQYAVTVVTADRPLRERVRRAGGMLCSPLPFLALCE